MLNCYSIGIPLYLFLNKLVFKRLQYIYLFMDIGQSVGNVINITAASTIQTQNECLCLALPLKVMILPAFFVCVHMHIFCLRVNMASCLPNFSGCCKCCINPSIMPYYKIVFINKLLKNKVEVYTIVFLYNLFQ